MIHLLDTDHMSLLERGGTEGILIRTRLRNLPPDDVGTSIISYEEQIRGWLSQVAQSTRADHQEAAYERLKRELRNYCNTAVFAYDKTAIAEYERLRRLLPRLGTQDLKIAAIAIANNATLLTRNVRDFSKVPGLRFEDWSV